MLVVAAAAPAFGAVTVSNVTSSTANGSCTIGASISIQVLFSAVVNVTGTPGLGLEKAAARRATLSVESLL